MPTVSYSITNTTDDVFYSATLGGGVETVIAGDVASLVGSTALVYAFFRFTGVAVPKSAVISAATVTIKRNDAALGSSGANSGSLKGVLQANVAALSDLSTIPSLPRTTSGGTVVNAETISVDVTPAVQQVVNQTAWTSGNAVGFVGDPTAGGGYVEIIDYSSSPANSAKLSITYTTGGSGATANVSITDAPDATSSSSKVAVKSAFTQADAEDMVSSATKVRVIAVAIKTDSNDTSSASATVAWSLLTATASITEALDSLSATASASFSSAALNASIQDDADALVAESTALAVARADVCDVSDSVMSVAQLRVVANASVAEEPDTTAATIAAIATASLLLTDVGDTLSSAAEAEIKSYLSAVDGNDALSSTISAGYPALTASADITDADDALASSALAAFPILVAQASIQDADDAASGSAVVRITASASIVEADDTLIAYVGSTYPAAIVTASIQDAGDVVTGFVRVAVTSSVVANDNDDTLSATAAVGSHAVASVIDYGDALSATVSVPIILSASIKSDDDTIIAVARFIVPAETPPSRVIVARSEMRFGVAPNRSRLVHVDPDARFVTVPDSDTIATVSGENRRAKVG